MELGYPISGEIGISPTNRRSRSNRVKLNLITDYALRSLIYLVWFPDRLVTAEEIASYYGISKEHIIKVLQELARRGFTQTRRGRKGGSVLARDPNEITIKEVIMVFEGKFTLLNCLLLENTCVIEDHCRLRGVLAEGQRRMLDYLETVSIGDVAGKTLLPRKQLDVLVIEP
jgi:Rrf2 family transcriptional regulator, nitric oxide-sensitive transcriptional repressor